MVGNIFEKYDDPTVSRMSTTVDALCRALFIEQNKATPPHDVESLLSQLDSNSDVGLRTTRRALLTKKRKGDGDKPTSKINWERESPGEVAEKVLEAEDHSYDDSFNGCLELSVVRSGLVSAVRSVDAWI